MLTQTAYIHTCNIIISINQNFMLTQLALHTYNNIHSINQNFMLNQLALHTYIHTYIHITASIVDPHELS